MTRDNGEKKPFNRGKFFIRAYVTVLCAMFLTAVFALLSQSAMAKTYVITDGERVVTYTSFADDPRQVLDQAGVDMTEDAVVRLEPDEGITILRGQTITIHHHGVTLTAYSPGETAGELLSRLGLQVDGEDRVTPSLDSPTYDGMVITIDQVQTRQETYTAAVPHAVRYCSAASLPQGTRQTLRSGADGELVRTARVTYVNGVEAGRQVLGETVLRMPVEGIVGVGTGEDPPVPDPQSAPVIGDGYIRLPTGEVLTYTGTATIRATAYTHTDEGCDYNTATGTAVRRGTAAVDPRYIPYGTRMFITSSDGSYIYGIATAEDCGGAIKGDRMDLYFPTYAECREFGKKVCTIYYLG